MPENNAREPSLLKKILGGIGDVLYFIDSKDMMLPPDAPFSDTTQEEWVKHQERRGRGAIILAGLGLAAFAQYSLSNEPNSDEGEKQPDKKEYVEKSPPRAKPPIGIVIPKIPAEKMNRSERQQMAKDFLNGKQIKYILANGEEAKSPTDIFIRPTTRDERTQIILRDWQETSGTTPPFKGVEPWGIYFSLHDRDLGSTKENPIKLNGIDLTTAFRGVEDANFSHVECYGVTFPKNERQHPHFGMDGTIVTGMKLSKVDVKKNFEALLDAVIDDPVRGERVELRDYVYFYSGKVDVEHPSQKEIDVMHAAITSGPKAAKIAGESHGQERDR